VMLLSVMGALLVSGCEAYRLASVPTEQIGGLYLETAMKDGQLTIVSVQEGTPAFRAGLLAGDVITDINGESTLKMSFSNASIKICGRAGTPVRLKTIRPSTQEMKECTLIREDLAHLNARSAASSPGQNSPAGQSTQSATTSLSRPAEPTTPF